MRTLHSVSFFVSNAILLNCAVPPRLEIVNFFFFFDCFVFHHKLVAVLFPFCLFLMCFACVRRSRVRWTFQAAPGDGRERCGEGVPGEGIGEEQERRFLVGTVGEVTHRGELHSYQKGRACFQWPPKLLNTARHCERRMLYRVLRGLALDGIGWVMPIVDGRLADVMDDLAGLERGCTKRSRNMLIAP